MLEVVREFFFFASRYFQKKRAEAIILNAEVISHYTGVYSVEIIKEIYEKQEKKNRYLKRVLDKYEQGKPKHEVYKGIFEDEFLKILQMAEEKRIPVSGVFKDYFDVKNKIEKAKKRIFSAVLRPVMLYLIASLIVFWALGQVLTKITCVKGVELSGVQTFYEFYWPIMLAIPGFILTALFKFPRKVPFLRRAFKELDAFQLLSLCRAFLNMGISTVEIVKIFQKVGVKGKKKIRKGLGKGKDETGVSMLVALLDSYLNAEEKTVLQIAGQTYEYERVIGSMVEKRSVEFDSRIEAITSVLGEVLTIVAMIPAGVLLATIMSVLASISSKLTF